MFVLITSDVVISRALDPIAINAMTLTAWTRGPRDQIIKHVIKYPLK